MGDGGAADDGSSPPAAAGFSYLAVFHNYPLVAALLGFAIAQSIKFFVTWYVSPMASRRPPALTSESPRVSASGIGRGHHRIRVRFHWSKLPLDIVRVFRFL